MRLIPWWLLLTIIIPLAVVGVVAFVYLRQWWARRKDRRARAGLDVQSQRALGLVRVRDRENGEGAPDAVEDAGRGALRRSRIGRQKRWLYFPPWYAIIGAPASGRAPRSRTPACASPWAT